MHYLTLFKSHAFSAQRPGMTRVTFLTVLVAVGGLSLPLSSYQTQQASIKQLPGLQKVRDNLYFIAAADETDRPNWTGGTTAVFITNTGVVLVDTKLPGYGRGILDQVRAVTDKPVTTIINTHTHFDHSGSNTEFPATVEYVVHENTRANMARETCQPVTNCNAFKGENLKYLPKRTYKDKLSLFTGRDQVDLYYFGPGHTNGDSFVVFPAVRAMHTGDMFQRKNMPFIDATNSGGSAIDFAQALEKAVAGIKDVDTIISGHSNVPLSWTDFQQYSQFYKAFLEYVQDGVKAGKAVDEVVAGYRVPTAYKDFQADPARVKGNVQAVFDQMRR
jgi:glyoxylase-like metal-dependent hydrolase (beta-lactamase superfamily II)